MMKRFSILIVLFGLFSTSVFAQEAVLVDEFGDLSCGDLGSRIDNFVVEISRTKGKSIGYVISYEGRYQQRIYDRKGNFIRAKSILPRFGESIQRANSIMKYVYENRGLSRNNIRFINGGFQELYTVQLWLVPQGKSLPELKPTLKDMKYRKGIPPDFCADYF